MSDVTEGDRVKATKLLRDAAVDKLIQSTEYRHQARMVERIAAALAAERAAAVADLRARVEAVAERYALLGSRVLELAHEMDELPTKGNDGLALSRFAALLRAAVTDTTGGPA